MNDYRDLIEQLSEDRMDVVVYAGFTRDNRLSEIVTEKQYMATEGRLIAAIGNLIDVMGGSGISVEDAARAFANVGAGRQNPRSFLEGIE